jgi:hypothetical protein
MSIKYFECKLTKCIILTNINNDIAFIDFPNFNQTINSDRMKSFFLLLRNTIDSLKELGIKLIRQYITINDWDTIFKDKSSWKLIDQSNEFCIIESNIENAIENISIGFGMDYTLKF